MCWFTCVRRRSQHPNEISAFGAVVDTRREGKLLGVESYISKISALLGIHTQEFIAHLLSLSLCR